MPPPIPPPKKEKHNLTEIGKSIRMNEECHFPVRVSRVHC